VATGPSRLLSGKKVWATIGLARARNGDDPREERRKGKHEKGEMRGSGNGKKLGRQGIGPRGLGFKESIFYFWFNSRFESNSILIQIRMSSTQTLNYSTQSIQKKMKVA
jgi:hypothetical protein